MPHDIVVETNELTKDTERGIAKQIGLFLLPYTAYQESYGLHACHELILAWLNAIDTDMPIPCYARDKATQEALLVAAKVQAEEIVDSAHRRAEAIVEAALKREESVRECLRSNLRALNR